MRFRAGRADTGVEAGSDGSDNTDSHRPSQPFDTVFGRMAVFAILVLFAVQAAWFAVLAIQGPRNQANGYARGLLMLLQAEHNDATGDPGLSPVNGVMLLPESARPRDGNWHSQIDGPMGHLLDAMRKNLPAGTLVGIETGSPRDRLWVRYPAPAATAAASNTASPADSREPNWIVISLDPPPPPPVLLESAAMLIAAVLLSIGAAWQMQRPMARVAQAARRFGKGERPPLVAEKGPREVRELIHAVNQMMRQLSQSEDEKILMLAGIAHDLKAPLTRMKLRASVLVDDEARLQFTRDVDSLTHIVQQFLEFAGSEPADGPEISVDAFIRAQFSMPETGEETLFVQHLRAGPAFTLPRTLIDRLASNLVDNALEHGSAPVELRTRRDGDHWVFEVRDHGPGIPEDLIEEAGKPFARLDPARSGDGHCGLGLAIVARLARKRRGRYQIENAPDGGLVVSVLLPVDPSIDRPVAALH
ncbi:ATP-binding protein [Robbsia andropogonis]|uniref:ATP-binding protein n=1 Tax=Robbsia andropogonis TaxID=28092 RepID=UPI002A6A73AD|nr:ATP-binding protein [Robbsia andropogonis]